MKEKNAIIRFIIGVAIGLSLSACQSSGSNSQQTAAELSQQGQSDSSFLSANAQMAFTEVNNLLDAIHQKRDVLCPQDQALINLLQPQLQAIQNNSSLSDAQKQAEANALFAQYQSQIQQAQAQMNACIHNNQSAWQALANEETTISQACLPPPPQNAPGGPGGSSSQPPQPPPPLSSLTPQQQQQLETLLTSSTCKQVIATLSGH